MMPLSYAKLEQLPDGRWTARCRVCGWSAPANRVKVAVMDYRRAHGAESLCTRQAGA